MLAFRDLVILNAGEDLNRLRATIEDLIETPEALSIGEDFMLLSSAKFELRSDEQVPVEIDMTQRVGLDLVLPVASLLPMERRVQWSKRMDIPRKVLDSLADGAELLAVGLTGGKYATVEKLLSTVSRTHKASRVAYKALPVLADAVGLAGTKLKEMNEQARAQHDYLRATLTQFKWELEQGNDDKVIRTAK